MEAVGLNPTFTEAQRAVEPNFMGVKIDTENGPSDPRVIKALERSAGLLDILKFIKVTKFKLNMTMFDYFWQVVVGNTRSQMATRVLEC